MATIRQQCASLAAMVNQRLPRGLRFARNPLLKNYECWRQAATLHALGNYAEAIPLYEALLKDGQFGPHASIRLASLTGDNAAAVHPADFVLVWQTGVHSPGSIVRALLKNVRVAKEIDDSDVSLPGQHKYTQIHPNMIVVDHVIQGAQAVAYYRACRARGCNIVLIHLADEHFQDTTEIYECCRLVFRNYWSPLLNSLKQVHFFPLGDNTTLEYPHIACHAPASGRDYVWNFLGDTTKADRVLALQAFARLVPNRVHRVSGFFDPRKMDAQAYREVLAQSAFTLCPDGYVNVDTFRFWEAIEFGSIPLVVRRDAFAYFESLLGGELPFPTFRSWQEAAAFVEDIHAHGARLDRLQQAMSEWWGVYKSTLAVRFGDAFAALRPPGAG